MALSSNVSLRGTLKAKRITPPKAPWQWRLQNTLRWSFIWGWLFYHLAFLFSRLTGIVTIRSQLRARHNRGGTFIYNEDGTLQKIVGGVWTDYGVLSYKVVTTAGVGFIVDAFQNLVELENMNFHGCGTGATAEAVGDVALVTESTTILNPDSTRATGTRSEPAANQLRTTGTPSFDGSGAITEHGLFSQAATGGGVLFDRSVFAAINVASGDGIQFEYTVTFTAGG